MMTRHMTVPSEAEQLPALMRLLREFWSAGRLPPNEALNFELALEEVFMNVVIHGSRTDHSPHVEVALTLLDDQVTMIVEDDGPPFDPLSLSTPDVKASLEQRPVGGLGVHLVRQMMDELIYQRCGTHNQLRMIKHLDGGSVEN
jgi:serine/threonine-protein kinase RsbW